MPRYPMPYGQVWRPMPNSLASLRFSDSFVDLDWVTVLAFYFLSPALTPNFLGETNRVKVALQRGVPKSQIILVVRR